MELLLWLGCAGLFFGLLVPARCRVERERLSRFGSWVSNGR